MDIHAEAATEAAELGAARRALYVPKRRRLVARKFGDYIAHDYPPIDTCWRLVPARGLAMVSGYRGAGKTPSPWALRSR